MKKNLINIIVIIALLIISAVLFSSCGPSKEEMEARERQVRDSTIKAGGSYSSKFKGWINIEVIDGCEYITYETSIIHKANCKNHK